MADVIEIEGPDGVVNEFPAGTPDAVIEAAMREVYGGPEGGSTAPAPRTLADRQREYDALAGKDKTLASQILDLERTWEKLPAESRADTSEAIAAMRREQKALREQMAKTSVGQKGRIIGGTAGGVLGGMAGAAATRSGWGAGAGSAAGTAMGSGLGTMVDVELAKRNAIPVSGEEAWKLATSNALTDAVWDAGGSLLFGVGGKVFRLTADKGYVQRLRQAIMAGATEAREGVAKESAEAAARRVQTGAIGSTPVQLAEEAERAAARPQAVKELAARSDGYIPSPGQITGDESWLERVTRGLHGRGFGKQQEALQGGAEAMRREALNVGQPARQELGQRVQKVAQEAEKAVKDATRPVFEEASKQQFRVDMQPVEQYLADLATGRARGALNKGLRDSEVGVLNAYAKDLNDRGLAMTAEGVLDDMSALKALLRQGTKDGRPSSQLNKIVGDLVGLLDQQYDAALAQANVPPGLKQKLALARNEYRGMMGTIYGDTAITKALGENPEDIGRQLWQKGNVTELDEVDNLFALAEKNGKLNKQERGELSTALLRGFLQESTPNLTAAANWRQALSSDAGKRETFDRLVKLSGVDAKSLTDGLKVLQEAATIAGRGNAQLAQEMGMASNAPSRAIVGGVLGYVTLPVGALVLTLDAAMGVLASSLARGDRGIYRDLVLVMRAAGADPTKATTQATRAAAGRVMQYATEHGIMANPPQEESQ